MKNLDKLCIHTITLKPWPLEKTLEALSERGIGGISVWQAAIEEMGPALKPVIC